MIWHKLYNKEQYYRLVALWVVCEAFAGGIMHGAKLPFTGMIVSSLAVTCITLIAWYAPLPANILKATIVVALFKLLLSPHSPPTAYIAVFFQGYLGYVLFSGKRYFTAAAILLAVLSLVESAIQRILVLWLLYGNTFWEAFDQYIQKLTGGGKTQYSQWMASGYILLHAIIGIFIGIYAVKLAKRSARWITAYPTFLIDAVHAEEQPRSKRRKKIKWIFVLAWLVLVFFFLQSYLDPAHAILSAGIVVMIFLRSLLIILSWYLLFAPLIMHLIKRGLQSQQIKQSAMMNEVLLLLPRTRFIFSKSWSMSATEKGFTRIRLFIKILVMNILVENSIKQQ